jgi:hypothetical protein
LRLLLIVLAASTLLAKLATPALAQNANCAQCGGYVERGDRQKFISMLTFVKREELKLYLGAACTRYASFASSEHRSCQRATGALVRAMGIMAMDQPPLEGEGRAWRFLRGTGRLATAGHRTPTKVIAFWDDLLELVLSGRVSSYLAGLPRGIQSAVDEDAVFNLWDYTLAFTGGNRAEALRWIGVLFQDTETYALAEVIRMRLGPGHEERLKLFEEAGTILQEAAANHPRNFQFYPRGIQTDRNKQYHFYSIAHLASVLSKDRKLDPRSAAFAPVLLNTSYEYAGIEPEPGKRTAMANRLRREPKAIDPATNPISLKDMYLGYAGAHWATTGKAPPLGQDEFTRRMAANPNEVMRELLKQ